MENQNQQSAAVTDATMATSQIWVFGSGECDQLGKLTHLVLSVCCASACLTSELSLILCVCYEGNRTGF